MLVGLAGSMGEACVVANSWRLDEPFKHPVNLRDISMFECVECHPKQ
jgi:hypothetical protein